MKCLGSFILNPWTSLYLWNRSLLMWSVSLQLRPILYQFFSWPQATRTWNRLYCWHSKPSSVTLPPSSKLYMLLYKYYMKQGRAVRPIRVCNIASMHGNDMCVRIRFVGTSSLQIVLLPSTTFSSSVFPQRVGYGNRLLQQMW